MGEQLTHARSLVEAYLYLKVTPCSVCKSGSLEASPPERDDDAARVRVVATCRNCGASEAYRVPARGAVPRVDPISAAGQISDTQKPSRILDVAQWVTLSGVMLEEASATPDRQEARWLRRRSGQCLEEALKFYEADNDLPSAASFFHEQTRQSFRDNPEKFTRQRLLDLRARLPLLDGDPSQKGKRRRWWEVWKK